MIGHDENGRFKKGEYKGGPGRPKRSKEGRYYEILISTVSKDDWKEIIKRAIYDAKRGDTAARTWLSNYIIGPAQQRVDVTTGGAPLEVVFKYIGDEGE